MRLFLLSKNFAPQILYSFIQRLYFFFRGAVIAERGVLIREESELNLDKDREKIKYLSDKIDQLFTSWKKSICICPVCGSRTSDMTFNPFDKYWYCTKCYEENHEFFKSRNEIYKFP